MQNSHTHAEGFEARAESTNGGCGTRSSSAKHYENEVAFFEAFLDPYMKYGSGYFETGDDFERASVRMLDRSIDHSGLSLGRRGRLLDVGSGWGAIRRRLADRRFDCEYHHVNPSHVQRDFIRSRFGEAAWTHPGGIESADLGRERFDAIFVHDSFCHMKEKGEVLQRLAGALAPGGRILLQDTFFVNEQMWRAAPAARTTRFIQNDVFGYAELIPVDAFVRAVSAANLHLRVLEDVSCSYKKTVSAWLGRLAEVDGDRFLIKHPCTEYLVRGAACMGYSTVHYFCVLERPLEGRRTLKESLRVLRRSSAGGQ